MRALHLFAVTPLIFVAFTAADPAIEKNVEVLQKAQSLEATITVTQVGGSTQEETLSLSKPNKLRWESPNAIVVGDGMNLWTYDKAKKTYTKSTSSAEAITKALSPEGTVAWSAFFNDKFAETIKSVAKANTRKARGADLVDYTVTFIDGRVMNISFNQANGVAWGYKFLSKGASADTIALVKELKIGEAGLADGLFAWTPPADATDAAAGPKLDPNSPKYADIKSIIDTNCASCHSGARPKARLDLSTYENIMSGRSVVAGSADQSKFIREIRSGKMPPAGPLPKGDLERLTAWVNGGAQP